MTVQIFSINHLINNNCSSDDDSQTSHLSKENLALQIKLDKYLNSKHPKPNFAKFKKFVLYLS